MNNLGGGCLFRLNFAKRLLCTAVVQPQYFQRFSFQVLSCPTNTLPLSGLRGFSTFPLKNCSEPTTTSTPSPSTSSLENDKSLSKTESENPALEFLPVFHFPFIHQVALGCKIKVYMTGLSGAMVPMVAATYLFTEIEPSVLVSLVMFIAFSMSTMTLMGEFFRRIVGIVYQSTDKKSVRIAHISFWGNRHDFIISREDIKLISETGEDPKNIFWRIHFYDKKEKPLFICTKYGGLKDPKAFENIFGKIDL